MKLFPYIWEGVSKDGLRIKGIEYAYSADNVWALLHHRGISPFFVKKRIFFFSLEKKIVSSEITLFIRQLVTMFKAGIPLVQALEVIAQSCENKSLALLIRAIKSNIEQGNTLASALKKYPQYFNTVYCNLVQVGEKTGTLDILLSRIGEYREKEEKLKAQIKKALFYPFLVIGVSLCVTIIMLIFVIPQFENLFKEFDAPLPWITQYILYLSNALKAYWFIFLLLPILGIGGFIIARKRFKKIDYWIDKGILHVPVIGNLLQEAILTRFMRTLETAFAAGMPLVEALHMISDIANNQIYTQAILRLRSKLMEGETLEFALKKMQFFPHFVNQMIAIGEKSGTLEMMLNRIADFYEERVNSKIGQIMQLLEPVFIIILSLIVGVLVSAMYIPLFQLGNVLK